MPTDPRATLARVSLVTLLLVAACGPATAPSPSPTPGATDPSHSPPPVSSPAPVPSPSPVPSVSPSPSPSGLGGLVESPGHAAALVLASDPRFAGIGPLLPDVIGQSAWYEAYGSDAADHGWEVDVTIGWDDCFAGCISRHTWHYAVSRDGTLSRPRELGDELPPDLPPPPEVTGTGSLDITLVAGPTCPVETQPPDPGCAPRPVGNATVIVRDADGNEVARTVSDAAGHARADGLRAGVYVVEAEAVEGYFGAPAAAAVWALGADPGMATLVYETGIR
jgi:hypothetical protein